MESYILCNLEFKFYILLGFWMETRV